MSEPRQYRRDPATGSFCEDRLDSSPLPLQVCDKCSGYYVGEQCSACHECPPTGVPCGVCEIEVNAADEADADEATDLDTSPTLLDMSDPPGGEQ